MEPLFTTTEIVAVLAGTATLALLAAGVRYLWRLGAAAMATEGDSRFAEVVRRLGISFATTNDERTLRAAAIGVRRCIACGHQEECDAWLADRAHKGVPPNCPNERFLNELTPR